jgi:chorismate mutase
MPSRLVAVRGATTLPADTSETMHTEVSCVLEALVSENHIQAEDIVAVFFTMTPDLHSVSPAKVARTVMPWNDVALFCSIEPDIVGLPAHAVRVMIQYYPADASSGLKHVYLNDAQQLRPDRVD